MERARDRHPPERRMARPLRRFLWLFFVLSGASGLILQIVWLRKALAAFGVITPFASIVVSVFMAGLALGAWLGGRKVYGLSRRFGLPPLILYGLLELWIAVGAKTVPWLFESGRALLLPLGGMNSGLYLALSSGVITVAMLPFCLAMGATLPVVMASLEEAEDAAPESFSFLYLANVVGAMLGAILTSVVLIELLGFARTLWVAAGCNGVAGVLALVLGRTAVGRRESRDSEPVAGPGSRIDRTASAPSGSTPDAPALDAPGTALAILFTTGLVTLALEIVWLRAFTPVLGTLVYAFSGVLTVYLGATWLGSWLYRRDWRRGRVASIGALLAAAAMTVLLPLMAAMPEMIGAASARLKPALGPILPEGPTVVLITLTLLSIAPFCAVQGYLTPMLVDALGRGDPVRGGRAYALNILGSVIGPLLAAYVLLPTVGARWAMLLLALPYAGFGAQALVKAAPRMSSWQRSAAVAVGLFVLVVGGYTGLFQRSFEEGGHLRNAVVRRDHTATVISAGAGMRRMLLVNGYGMTVLTTSTKVMAHLPLASLDHAPKKALVIAFGMGSTFRSLLSWDIEATAVELVPSVAGAFEFYHDDAGEIRSDPRARIVIDDGRRFLARSGERFDLITVDPPPPVETAGSSLLYAEEFFALAKSRLAPGGILHHWFPDGSAPESLIREAAMRSAAAVFPHIRLFRSLQGRGIHMLCTEEPLEIPDAERLLARMPESARADLREWLPRNLSLETFLERDVLARELSLEALIGPLDGPTIIDDRPFNEYFAMRRLF
jgi:spermidine synthase